MPTLQNHLLVINPSEITLRLVRAGVDTKTEDTFNVTVLITSEVSRSIPSKEVFKVENNANLIDLRKEEWDSSLKFSSAIAYEYYGQRFLENIQSQILLNNVESNTKRLESYYNNKPESGGFLVESITYCGRHIVIQCIKFNNGTEVKNEFDTEWEEIAQTLFNYLDQHQIINGPSQVYFNANNEPIGLRLHPSNIPYADQLKATSRHWWDAWPSVLLLQKDSPNIAFRKFYEWSTRTGETSKKYWTGSEVKLPE